MVVSRRAARGFVEELQVAIGTQTGEAAAALLQAAEETERRKVLAEQTARAGIAPTATLIVDGRRGAPVAAIRADSFVAIDWNYLREAVARVVGYLHDHGPERSGDWKKSIVVMIDGAEHDLSEPIPADAEDAVVAVTVPYARRLEVGRRADGRPLVLQVEQHFVEHTALTLRRELAALAQIGFSFVSLSGAHQLTDAWQHRRVFRAGVASFGATKRRIGGQTETEVQYPAITIAEIRAA